ncbi:hypothetical protein SLS62_009680 [Diatrype stigma]|uniref:Kinesin motor domain-containing protein n=1 Tax=Diatrype stigma TaxID=117547 RepID=A0AAN9YJY8_9PEZI
MSVRVVARIRPLLEKELEKDVIVHAASNSSNNENGKPYNMVKIPNPKNEAEEFSFAFNGVYDHATTQEALFSAEVNPHLKSLFQGLDVTIFAYGVTGTGKTHTMRGGLKLADRGVIPRLLSGVFRRAKKLTKDTDGETDVAVTLSYYEIYNDKVFDLLEPVEKRTPAGLPLREAANGRTQVVGLSERACGDLRDFERLYIEANTNRVTAATKLNALSSRSHAILRVKVTQTTGDAVRESTASAIDLAGSEDNRRTENGKERLVESAAINKSLFVLSQCIDAISRGDRRIPFRESKMTRILSLGQNSGITIMILNLAPLRSYHLDTLSSLNVSSRAKRIEVREIENEVVFKQPPRGAHSSGGAGGVARQPLRPLANSHNITAGTAAANASKPPADRPVKAFNVYTDHRSKAAPASAPASSRSANTSAKRASSSKRPSESDGGSNSRPTKITRPAVSTTTRIAKPPSSHQSQKKEQQQQPSISAADIEAMVEKKVQEILASRAAAAAAEQEQQPVMPHSPPRAEINEAVQRRLEALERRIEDHDRKNSSRDGESAPARSSDSLRYLLQARQHKERGDDAGALRLYEMALPFFPGQAKLMGKIEKLRAKLGIVAADSVAEKKLPSGRAAARGQRNDDSFCYYRDTNTDNNDDADADIDDDDEDDDRHTCASSGSPRGKGKARGRAGRKEMKSSPVKAKAKAKTSVVDDDDAPTARALLDIVNSLDVSAIIRLQGFGPKKARDLVDHLDSRGEVIENLAQLRMVPGMGGRAVDRACEGLAAAGCC